MDVEEFAREVSPHLRRSRLWKFKDQVWTLKRTGYSDMQIRDWLAANGVAVSRQNVQKFIKRHLGQLCVEPLNQVMAAPVHEEEGIQRNDGSTTASTHESRAEKMRRLAEEQRHEADKSRFKHDKIGSHL